ncbi:MAG: hypothetical protein ACI9MC_000039 [Kiritimatiellia bacterium]|jgi:hypothetical protein
MANWVVSRGDSQFQVDGLQGLIKLADGGDLDAGDLIQPQGASDWLYAIEIPELKGRVKSSIEEDEEDLEFKKGGASKAIQGVLYVLFALLFVGGAGGMGYFYTKLPQGGEALIGEGGALKYTELLSLAVTPLRGEPQADSGQLATIAKDEVIDLLAKRGGFYKARTKGGQEGWVAADDMLAVYQMGNKKERARRDPLYNPDQYVSVSNANWSMLDKDGNTTATFRFQLQNTSRFDMTDMKLQAVIKDSKGTEVSTVEFAIEGTIPAEGTTLVGTFPPSDDELKQAKRDKVEPPPSRLMAYFTFDKWASELEEKEQEDAYLRWLDGVDVEVEEAFVEATVRIVELRAVPLD